MWDTPAGLLGEPLLYHGNGVENWAQWFSAVGAPRERLKLASGFDQVSLLVRAVMADMGIAVLQRCLVRDDLLAGRVAAPFPGCRRASPAATISARRHGARPRAGLLQEMAAGYRRRGSGRGGGGRPASCARPLCRACCARRDKAPRKGLVPSMPPWKIRARAKPGPSPFVRFAQPFGAAAQAAEMILAAFLAATLRRVE